MKKRILSAMACLVCLVYLVSPVGALAVGETIGIEIIEQTIFSELLRSSMYDGTVDMNSGLTGIQRQVINKYLEYMTMHPNIEVGDNDTKELSFLMPKYQIVTGKYQLHSTFDKYNSNGDLTETTTNDTLFECTCIFTDTDDLCGEPIAKDKNTGRTYFSNALNLTVYFPSGAVDRIVCVYRTNMFNRVSVSGGNVNIGFGQRYDVYWYTGENLDTILYENVYDRGVRFQASVNNSITQNLETIAPSNATQSNPTYNRPSGFSTNWSGEPLMRDELTIQDYTYADDVRLLYRYIAPTSSNKYSNRNFYALNFFYVGFYTTNDTSKESTLNQQWEQKSEQNYYVDNTFVGGTTINETNYNSYGGGGLAPVFTFPDVDLPNLPWAELLEVLAELLPDIGSGFAPSVEFSVDSLFDKLLDFFGGMPDIGLPWGGDDDNDYWLELPDIEPPDSGGGGSGDITVNVDITRPKIPYIDTSPQITLYIPTVTTTALPSGVITASKKFVEWGVDVTDAVGTTSLIVICGFIGVGVMFLFKDW